MSRRVTVIGAGAFLVAGCLFPSFDNLKSDDLAAKHGAGDDDPSDKDGGKISSSSGATSSGSTSGGTSSSGEIADAGADTGAPAKKTIACADKTCDVDTSFCCDEGFGNTSCKSKGSSCSPWRFECDDFTDCTNGQICCHQNGSLEAKCATTCNGDEICATGTGCTTGTCGPELAATPDVKVRVCN